MLLQQPKSGTLQSIVVELGAADKGKPPSTLGRAIHAQVLHWLQLSNPDVAEAVHESSVAPLSLSGLLGNRRPSGSHAGDTFYFRVCLLDGNLIEPLLVGLEQWGTQPIVLGNFPFVLRSVYTLPGTHRLAGATSYDLLAQDLRTTDQKTRFLGPCHKRKRSNLVQKTDFCVSPVAKTPQINSDIELKFLSPTSFKQQQSVQLFPLPELVFGNLLRRWNTFAPENLRFPDTEWKALVSAYELKTYALKLEGGSEIGSQGWVRYHFLEAEQAKIANILAHFAFFAGIGRKTTMGMGQVQFLPLSLVPPLIKGG